MIQNAIWGIPKIKKKHPKSRSYQCGWGGGSGYKKNRVMVPIKQKKMATYGWNLLIWLSVKCRELERDTTTVF